MPLSLPASAAAVYCYINIDANNGLLSDIPFAPIYQKAERFRWWTGSLHDISAGKCYVGVAGTSYIQVWRTFVSVTSAWPLRVLIIALNGLIQVEDLQ
jgi:hypothetical protein